MLGLLGSAFGGTFLGLFGSLATQVISIFKTREDIKLKKIVLDAEFKLQQLQIQAQRAETEGDIALADIRGSIQGLKASIHDQSVATANALPWVASILALVRPTITAILLANLIWLNATGHVILATTTAVELTATVVSWWFGDRSSRRQSQLRKIG